LGHSTSCISSAPLAAAFVALHLGTLLLDSYLPFTVANLLVPAGEPYRPLATDLGVLSLYALAVVLISSWLRGRLKYGTWRSLHYTSFVAFALVTTHGLLAGTDAAEPWMSALYLGAAVTVAILVGLRVALSSARHGTSARKGAQVATR
jgi:methionine sulfoxide reductase heme-binding subunit